MPVYLGQADAAGNWSVPVTDPLALDNFEVRGSQSLKGSPFGAQSDPLAMVIAPGSPISGTAAALHLDFAEGRYFRNGLWVTQSEAFDFARLSDGVYRDAEGDRETAGAGVLRIDHDPVSGAPLGALIEGGRSNSLVRSRDFDVSKIVQGGTIADSGTWQLFTEDMAPTALHRVFIPSGTSTVSGQAYSLSALAKYVSRRWVYLVFTDGAATHFANFDLRNGVKGSVSAGAVSIMLPDVDGGWLLGLTATATNTTSSGNAQMGATDGNVAAPRYFNGDGSAFLASEIQFEAGSFPSSRIRTDASAATRAADILTVGPVGGVPFEGWNTEEGTLFVECGDLPNATDLFLCALPGGAGGIGIRRQAGNVAIGFNRLNGLIDTPGVTFTWGKVAHAFKSGDSALSTNGSAAVEGSNTFDLSIVRGKLNVGSYINGANQLFTCIKRLEYYPARLSNSELEAMTA